MNNSSKIFELPHSIDAERAALGAMLFSNDARDQILDILTEDDFYDEHHRALFRAIALFKENNNEATIDRVTFENFLRSVSLLERCGGIEYVEELSANAPITSNAISYANIVKDNALRRKTIKFAESLSTSAFDETKEIDNTIDEGCGTLTDLSTYGTNTDDFVQVSSIVQDLGDEIERLSKLGLQNGIQTGFQKLDKMIGGFKKSQYVVVAARPSCGKTAFALSCMSNMLNSFMDAVGKDENGNAIKISKPVKVGFFSLEMPREDILKRLISMRSLVPHSYIVSNTLFSKAAEESNYFSRVYETCTSFREIFTNFFIYDSTAMSITNIKSAARKLKRTEDVDIIFIDYFSRINTNGIGSGKMQSWEMWSVVSRELKNLAFELKIPVVCLVQLNREAEKTKPTLANLRDTGAIEQDADIVIMLHDGDRNETPREGDTGDLAQTYLFEEQISKDVYVKEKITKVNNIEAIVAKHRNGETGSTDIVLLQDFIRFVDVDRLSVV